MKNYQSFRRATLTPYVWLDLVIIILIWAVLLYVIDYFIKWLFMGVITLSPASWSSSLLLSILLTLFLFGFQVVRIYPEQKGELRLYNMYHFLFYSKISISNIELVVVNKSRKIWMNTLIFTHTGKKYYISVANYRNFTAKLKEINPQIAVHEF